MDERKIILDALENPEVLEKVVSRRDAFGSMGAWGAGLALASVPVALAAMTKRAFAQTALPDQVINVLNFALVLEYLEAEFYNRGLAAEGLIPPDLRDVFETISRHENAHVAFLMAVLGAQAARRPAFDFTAGGMFPDVFTNFGTFVTLAQGFEDTGVRAYKGQAPKLLGSPVILTAALRIHSVEARHASMVRRLAASPAEEGWIPFDNTDVAALRPVYEGEANVVHAGINAAEVTDEPLEAVTEAFDEPLGLREVLAIAGMFGQR
ncbi:MAG TPA: ferritin-like domain-containing protein [Thermomicrobiales bacterium]|nr:ferritin-like domain-containing protein [Thermomicrobiales bacterium]